MVVGLRNGDVRELTMSSGAQVTYVQSHNSGEVWGLS